MFWLKILKDFIKIFREGQDPKQVAWGFALGMIVGLSPMFNLQGLIIWLLILILNVNIAAAFLAFTFFSIVAFIFDPLFHMLGYEILTQLNFLDPTYTYMYNAPLLPLTNFNNTVVMGSFVSALVLIAPTYFAMKKFILSYRKHIGSKVEKWKVYKILKQSTVVRTYVKIRDLGGLR